MNQARNLTEWTEAVLDRDGYVCQYPGCGKNTCLDAIHLIARSADKGLRLYIPNGAACCRPHHIYLDNNRAEKERFIAYVLDQRRKGYALVAAA